MESDTDYTTNIENRGINFQGAQYRDRPHPGPRRVTAPPTGQPCETAFINSGYVELLDTSRRTGIAPEK